ncbi:MAG: hypothetical protein ACFFCW_30200 [Candidatus Hodarchaeota archaeon]
MNDYDAKRCYLCGLESSDSVDHLPPKNLFLKKYRNIGADLITVPAHIKCNKEHALDDEYFRYCLLVPAYWESDYARELWNTKIKKQVHRTDSEGFRKYLLDKLASLEITTPSGIYLGEAEAAMLDAKRMIRVIERIARGIYYKHTEMILPLDWPVDVKLMSPAVRKDRIRIEKKGKFVSIGKGIFRYFWNYTNEDRRNGFFWFVFFDCVDFWVRTGVKTDNRKS